MFCILWATPQPVVTAVSMGWQQVPPDFNLPSVCGCNFDLLLLTPKSFFNICIVILSCILNTRHDRVTGIQLFKQVCFSNGSTHLSPNLQSVTYCTALRDGREDDWNFLWNKYVNSNYATEQSLILTALGCTTNQALINK
jgi:hypothetical protein